MIVPLTSNESKVIFNDFADGVQRIRHHALSNGDRANHKYAVRVNDDSDGPPKIYIFHLEGGSEKNDPLKEYRILELVVTRVDYNKLFITGIRNGQDCFEDHGTKDQVSYMNQRYEHFVENILLL